MKYCYDITIPIVFFYEESYDGQRIKLRLNPYFAFHIHAKAAFAISRICGNKPVDWEPEKGCIASTQYGKTIKEIEEQYEAMYGPILKPITNRSE